MHCPPLILAHRGASKDRPENTLAAFRRALELGADGIELDVQLSKDGHIVVIHDERLERTTNGRGWVKDHTLDELRRLDAGGWFGAAHKGESIPTLQQVFELAAGFGLINVELKNSVMAYEGLETKVIVASNAMGLPTNIVVSSFNHGSLMRLRSLDPSVMTATLHEPGLWSLAGLSWIPLRRARKVGAAALHLPHQGISQQLVRRAHAAELKVRVWTVNDPQDVRRALELGVDGLITDDPAGVKNMLART